MKLDLFLIGLRQHSEGLALAKQFVIDSGGQIELASDGIVILRAMGEEAYCFQPYPDIDRFYFEM